MYRVREFVHAVLCVFVVLCGLHCHSLYIPRKAAKLRYFIFELY